MQHMVLIPKKSLREKLISSFRLKDQSVKIQHAIPRVHAVSSNLTPFLMVSHCLLLVSNYFLNYPIHSKYANSFSSCGIWILSFHLFGRKRSSGHFTCSCLELISYTVATCSVWSSASGCCTPCVVKGEWKLKHTLRVEQIVTGIEKMLVWYVTFGWLIGSTHSFVSLPLCLSLPLGTYVCCILCAVGVAGDIIAKILDCGFEISAMIQVTMERANAEEFYEVYKGVVQEYPMMVTELSSGPCIAFEVRARDAAKTFREFVGPADPVSGDVDCSYCFDQFLDWSW